MVLAKNGTDPCFSSMQKICGPGDVIGWFDSGQEEWPHGRALEGYLLKLGTLVSELQTTVPELAKMLSSSACRMYLRASICKGGAPV